MRFIVGLLRYVVVIFAAAFLAIVCLGAWLVIAGHVNAGKIELVRRALLGELVPAESVTQAEQDENRYDKQAIEEAQAALVELKKQEEELAVRIAERRNQLAQFESESARIRRETVVDTQALAKARKEFEAQKAAYADQLKSDGFKKMKETFQLMSVENVAEMLYDMETALAVELLKAFKKDERAKCIDAIIALDKRRAVSDEKRVAPRLLKEICEGEPNLVSVRSE